MSASMPRGAIWPACEEPRVEACGDVGGVTATRVGACPNMIARRCAPVSEVTASRDQLYGADEVFLTGTAAEITPVREIDLRKIGSGKIGPVTRRIRARFESITRGREAAFDRWLRLVLPAILAADRRAAEQRP